jgi:GT2 family glycosyltransferase
MISIVVCSIKEALFAEFARSVKQTIGVPYELIRIDNNIERLGICAAYNKGASLARYDILCFSHEDIEFKTDGWGQIVVDFFASNDKRGAIGVAGSTFRARTPTGWRVDLAHDKANVLQPSTGKDDYLLYCNQENDSISQVVQLDGLWMCTRKSVWQAVLFNEREFPGFHYYDIDFSLRVHLQGFEVCVTYAVSIKHLSRGTYGEEWIQQSKRFLQRWRSRLPVSLDRHSEAEINQLTYSVYESYFNFLLTKVAKRHSFIYLRGCILSRPLKPSNVKKALRWSFSGTGLGRV